jgi:hypothetical protein
VETFTKIVQRKIAETDPVYLIDKPNIALKSEIPDVSNFVDTTDARLSDARTPLEHDHAIADVTGLQEVLNDKSPLVHGHVIFDVEGLWDTLENKALKSEIPDVSNFVDTDDARLSDARTPIAHMHSVSEVTGLENELADKALVDHDHIIADVTGLQDELDDKALVDHDHTGTYEPANSNIQNHISSTSNPHGVTKSQVGLSNVDDVKQMPLTYQSFVCNGRLTLSSGNPVYDTSSSTIYFTPYCGNKISLYNGTAWEVFSFTELSLALTGLTADKNYDIFVYNNSGTLTLERLAWTGDLERATALVLQDGVYVKSGATTRLYLGTFRATGSTTTTDTVTKRFVYNKYNKVARKFLKRNSASAWNYNSTTWRYANNDSTQKVEYVIGDTDAYLQLTLTQVLAGGTAGAGAENGIGLDRAGLDGLWGYSTLVTYGRNIITTTLTNQPTIGYHYAASCERSNTNGTTVYFESWNACGLMGYITC